MPVEEARAFFTERPVRVMLDRLADVGLGYISLGQELDTLSGGERQRLKLAIEMSGDTEVYVLDEPTTGLHMQDVDNLIGLLDRLVDAGRTVIVIEHNLDVVARADWVIDLGPGGGHDGGRVIFEGTPAELAAGRGLAHRTVPPAPALQRHVGGQRGSKPADPSSAELHVPDVIVGRTRAGYVGPPARSCHPSGVAVEPALPRRDGRGSGSTKTVWRNSEMCRSTIATAAERSPAATALTSASCSRFDAWR